VGAVAVEADGTVVLSVYVQPGATRAGIVGLHGDALKLRVTAPPEDGRANKAVVALLAEACGLAPSAVELVRGATSRRKQFRLSGLTEEELTRRVPAVSGD
jgi:hypothetical protein